MQSLTLTCTVHQQQDFEEALKASKIKFTKSVAGKINRKPCVTYFFPSKPASVLPQFWYEIPIRQELAKKTFEEPAHGADTVKVGSEGVKHDSEKPRTDLLITDFPRALLEVAKVAGFGAKKYAAHNWLLVENGVERYSAAGVRHQLQHATGELLDEETGLRHLAHAAWNALAVLELELRNGNDK